MVYGKYLHFNDDMILCLTDYERPLGLPLWNTEGDWDRLLWTSPPVHGPHDQGAGGHQGHSNQRQVQLHQTNAQTYRDLISRHYVLNSQAHLMSTCWWILGLKLVGLVAVPELIVYSSMVFQCSSGWKGWSEDFRSPSRAGQDQDSQHCPHEGVLLFP